MDLPGARLHPLSGERAGQWSVKVSGNWRIVFRFEGREAVDVDLVDYH
jgi:addiction module HigA family antidote